METPTQFDLEASISEWRKDLTTRRVCTGADLNELEQHLRDSIVALQRQGLTAREAFWVARDRIGSSDLICKEFRKAHPDRIWLDRTIWAIVFHIAYSGVSGLIGFLSLGASYVVFTFLSDANIAYARSAFVLLLTVAAAVAIWKGAHIRPGNWLQEQLRSAPVLTCGALILALSLVYVGGTASFFFFYQQLPVVTAARLNQSMVATSYLLPVLITIVWLPILLRLSRRSEATA